MFKQAVFLALLATNSTTFAVTPAANMEFGAVQISQTSPQSINHSGVLQLDNVKVADTTVVNGYLMAKNSQFHAITINGQCQLENSELLGPVTVNGQLQLKNVNADAAITVNGFMGARSSLFEKTITVTSSSADFIDSTLQDITLEPVKNQSQRLNLTRTKVKGDVVFAAGNGVVRLDPESSIAGKVTGGKIEKVASKPEVKPQQ